MRRLAPLLISLTACDDYVVVNRYSPDWDGTVRLMNDNCVSCHAAGGRGAETVILPDGVADDIVNGNGDFVVPGDPARSKLWQVLSAADRPAEVLPMPLGTNLHPDTIASVRTWIANGASLATDAPDTDAPDTDTDAPDTDAPDTDTDGTP